jgi:hypothetical protein
VFSIARHFYPICFDKCCPPFPYIGGPKGKNFVLPNKTFYFGEPPYIYIYIYFFLFTYLFIFNDGLIGLLPRKTNRRHKKNQNTIFIDPLSDPVHGSQIHPETFIFLQMFGCSESK